MTDFGDRFLLSTNKAQKDTDHSDQSENGANNTSTRLRMSLESQDGVNFQELDECENPMTNETRGVLFEDWVAINDVIIGFKTGSLENRLDLKSLGGEGFGILDGMANVDIVEQDILSHGPELNTDTTLAI